MKIITLSEQVSVSEQISAEDIAELKRQGVEIIVCNRPDGESSDQPDFNSLKRVAAEQGIDAQNIPFVAGEMDQQKIALFKAQLDTNKRLHAYCRTGNRSTNLWRAAIDVGAASSNSPSNAQSPAKTDEAKSAPQLASPSFDVVIVGAGSGGIACAASILKRHSSARVALIDDAQDHYYQPGWTLVGGGVFEAASTKRTMASVIPKNTTWIQQKVGEFLPEDHCVVLDNNERIYYSQLVVAAGLKLDWDAIEGLQDTLGRNGVTSNYDYSLAPYTSQLVDTLKRGKAIFTQPPMPIKCAGAPQKALYLSCDTWLKKSCLADIEVDFYNAGGVIFGVKEYVPALQSYIDKYGVNTHFNSRLVKIDGASKTAWFSSTDANGDKIESSTNFDMIHVCPPQSAPDFIKNSVLADAAGWVDVDQETLQHTRFENIWVVGDAGNTSNAKTMAAVRKQAPVVAQNVVDALRGKPARAVYDGYGSCPLTVEHGKVVLAEFGYGGKLLPSFPKWLNDGTKATRMAWFLKADVLPAFYWHGMLKGREWLASPKMRSTHE